MRAAFVSFGSHGDLQPLIPLAQEWQRRGHDVFIAANDEIVPLAREYGIPARPLGVNVRELLASDAGSRLIHAGSAAASLKVLASMIQGQLFAVGRRMAEAVRDADVIVVNERYFLLAESIAEQLGVPVVQICFQPKGETSAYQYPYYKSWMFRFMSARGTHRLVERTLAKRFLPAVNELRRYTLKLPKLSVNEALERKRRTAMIQGYSPRVCPPPRDWPEHNVVSGYWHLERSAEQLPTELSAFLDTDVRKICVGFGSMLYDPAALGKILSVLARELGVRIVWSLNWSANGAIQEGPLSPEVYVVNGVGHDALFPLVDCVVHHGGAGTTGTALRHGKPQVVSWFMLDQEFWASRVSALSVGVNVGSFHQLTPSRLTEAVRSALDDPRYRRFAESISQGLRIEDGPRVACDRILSSIARLPTSND